MDKKTILSVALGAVLATSLFVSLFFFQIVAPVQQSVSAPKSVPALEKFKVSGQNALPIGVGNFVVSAGKDRGIWARYGLDPEFIPFPLSTTELKEQVASGIKIGLLG